MKIKHFFGLAVLAAMTASCSSNNELVNGGNGSGEVENGTAYASFKINLPTTSGTRALGDPDGTPDLMKVLLLSMRLRMVPSLSSMLLLISLLQVPILEP